MTAVTGVAGSGKSILIAGSLNHRDGVITIDQAPIKDSRRSSPPTYTGMLESIRKAFVKVNGVKPALLSANSEGACPVCNGAGIIYFNLGRMAGMSAPCDVCEGKGFQAKVLGYTLGGKNIREVLDLSVTAAVEYFAGGQSRLPAVSKIIGHLAEVGLGYLSLGQPLTTFFGWQAAAAQADHASVGQGCRFRICHHPRRTDDGLHLADVETILDMLDGLAFAGGTVILIEHHQAVMAHSD